MFVAFSDGIINLIVPSDSRRAIMSVAVGDFKKLHGVPKDMESVDALIHKKDDCVRKEFEK